MCIHFGVPECPYCLGITVALNAGTSPILLEVVIPQLHGGYILKLQSVTHCLLEHCDLNSENCTFES